MSWYSCKCSYNSCLKAVHSDVLDVFPESESEAYEDRIYDTVKLAVEGRMLPGPHLHNDVLAPLFCESDDDEIKQKIVN